MKRTMEYVNAQNTDTSEEIQEQIEAFRDKRLSEEQWEQNNVIIFVYNTFCIYLYTISFTKVSFF